MKNKTFLAMALGAGLLFSPVMTSYSFSQPPQPKCPALDALGKDGPSAIQTPEKKRLEKALRDNMQSARTIMRAAKKAGADKATLEEMGKLSAEFLKLFVSVISRPVPQQPAKPEGRPAQPAPRKPLQIQPAPRVNPQQEGLPPQGFIITTPDGTQWLVMPKGPEAQAPAPATPRPMPAQPGQMKSRQPAIPGAPVIPPVPPTPGADGDQPAPAPQPLPEGVIILDEGTTGELQKWPTKDQYAKDGIMEYMQKFDDQEKGVSTPENMQFSSLATPNGLIIVGEQLEEQKPVWPTKEQYAHEGILQYAKDVKAGNK